MEGEQILSNMGLHNLRIRQNSKKNIHIRTRVNRKTLQTMARPLKRWLCKNKTHPYPTRSEKQLLCIESNMTVTQVSNWFANARRRLKITVSNPEVNWEGRITLYNDYIVGKQELLSEVDNYEDEKQKDEEDEEKKDNCIHDKLHYGITGQCKESNNNNETKQYYHNRIDNGIPCDGGFANEMMYRYLNEQQQLVFANLSRKSKVIDQRSRHTSGSLNDFGESQRSCSESECNEDDIYWKEINAAMALTDLSRIRHNP